MEYREILRSIDENVQSLSKISPEYIIEFTEKDAENISKMIQIDDSNLLFYEVQLVKIDLSECESILDASAFVHNRKSTIPFLAKAFDYLLTMPVTVVSVERSFSKTKIVKNRLRTKMNDDRLNSILSAVGVRVGPPPLCFLITAFSDFRKKYD